MGCHPTVKNTDPELFLSKRTAWTKIEKRLRKRRSSDLELDPRPNLGSSSRGDFKARHYGVLACRPSERSNKQLTKMEVDTHTQTMD